MTKKQAKELFVEHYLPSIPRHDTPWLDQAWNDFVDGLQRDGAVTRHQADTWVQPRFTSKDWNNAS